MGGSITPGGLKPVTQSPVRQGLQALDRERRPSSISAQSFEPRAVSAGNSDIRVEAETRHAGATGAGSTVDRFRIDSVPRQHNAAASVDPGGEAAADGTRVDLRQPGLIARQRIRVFRVRLWRVQAATLQQGANPLRQRLRQFSDFGILGRPQSKELRLSMQSRRVYAIDAKYVEMDMKQQPFKIPIVPLLRFTIDSTLMRGKNWRSSTTLFGAVSGS